MNNLPKTCAEALKVGAPRYMTGEPCASGHVAARYVAGRVCVECVRLCAAAKRAQNPESHREAARVWRKNNPKKYLESARAYKARNPDKIRVARKSQYEKNRDKAREYARIYYRENREQCLRRAKEYALANANSINAYRAANRDKALVRSLRWRKKNPKYHAIMQGNRRALKRSRGRYTPADIADILRMQHKRCAMPWCRVSLARGYHVDHIISLKDGGSNDRRNLQALCPTCNMRKSSKDPIAFAQEMGLLL